MQAMNDLEITPQTVAVIPARGGSKGIPGKNVRLVAGLELIAHSVVQAVASKGVDKVYVSTDDIAIANAARAHGAEVIDRPSAIAGDVASSESALLHALDQIEATVKVERMVFLQCTSPIREPDDIDRALATFDAEQADSLLSVAPSHRFLWGMGPSGPKALNYDPANRPRRQDMAPQYVENGSIYIFKPWVLKQLNNRLGGRIALYPMASRSAFEIDDELDMAIIDFLLRTNTTASHGTP